MSARSYKASGIVMRARNLGEADKIVTLFTLEHGKIDAVAKGIRRPKSPLVGRLEFVTEAALTLHRGRSLDVITSAEIRCAHWHAIVAPDAFATAHLIIELVDSFSERGDPMSEVYELVRGALAALESATEPAALVPRFGLRLLGTLGLAPQCDACVRCGRPLEATAAWADVEAGGLACASCRPHRADSLALAPDDVMNFRRLASWGDPTLRPVARATNASARAVDAFVTWHLGKRTKAGRMIDELAPRRATA